MLLLLVYLYMFYTLKNSILYAAAVVAVAGAVGAGAAAVAAL